MPENVHPHLFRHSRAIHRIKAAWIWRLFYSGSGIGTFQRGGVYIVYYIRGLINHGWLSLVSRVHRYSEIRDPTLKNAGIKPISAWGGFCKLSE